MGDIQFVFEGHFVKYRTLFLEMYPPPMTIRKGHILCSQCHTSGWMYYMLDGLSKVYITTNDGNERIIDPDQVVSLFFENTVEGGFYEVELEGR